MIAPLHGKSVLIVEDEIIVGMMLANEIERAGGTSIGPVGSAAAALNEIEHRSVDVVVLDAKLADGWSARLAACLEDRGISYVVVSGYDAASLPVALKKAVFVAKPISLPVLIETIESLVCAGRQLPLEGSETTGR